MPPDLHLQRVGSEHPGRNGPLRRVQGGPAGPVARLRQGAGRHGRHRQHSLLPGPTRTEGARAFLADLARDQGSPEDQIEACFLAENRPSTLIRRFAEPQEAANLRVHVASPLSSATTGAALRVGGGVMESARA